MDWPIDFHRSNYQRAIDNLRRQYGQQCVDEFNQIISELNINQLQAQLQVPFALAAQVQAQAPIAPADQVQPQAPPHIPVLPEPILTSTEPEYDFGRVVALIPIAMAFLCGAACVLVVTCFRKR